MSDRMRDQVPTGHGPVCPLCLHRCGFGGPWPGCGQGWCCCPQPHTTCEVVAAGVYDLPHEVYHADPVPGGSLSASGARRLLRCPARFRHDTDHPGEDRETPELIFGRAYHRALLGAGPDIDVVDAADWRTKQAREARAESLAAGRIPLLAAEAQRVEQMQAVLRVHPTAGRLFLPGSGTPEQSLFWPDQGSGVWRRARLDWLPNRGPGPGRMLIPDLKTCRSAAPADLPRAVHEYGYHQQADWYLSGVRALHLAEDAVFLLVFQEREPPYLVTVAQLDPVALRIGAELNNQALYTYAQCQLTGVWPGYTEQVEVVPLPGWVEARHQVET